MRKYSLLSLFCGAGGLDTGFKASGYFQSLLAVDINRAAVETFRRNHTETRVEQLDLSSAEAVDQLLYWWDEVAPDQAPAGIIGGPPCQSFSISNVEQRADDPRSSLLGHYVRILDAFNGKYGLDFFVFENVPGLLHRRHRWRFNHFLEDCENIGFQVGWTILDAVEFGVPQYRERVFVVGLNVRRFGGAKFDFTLLPKDSHKKSVWDAIGHLPEPEYFKPSLTPADIPFHENHWCMVPRSRKFKDGTLKAGTILGRSFRVLNWEEPSWTVAYGNREVHVHPRGHRRLSIYEAMLLQGFPENYKLKGTLSEQIDLVSDAVPPPLAAALAKGLAMTLDLREPLPEYERVRR